LYDEGDDSTYAYANSDDDLFSEATTILDELDDIYEVGVMSPDSYLAPDADVETANMESFLENSSQKGTMSDDDDDVAIPREKSIAHHYMRSKMVYVSFDVETGGKYCGIIQMSANIFRINNNDGEIERESFHRNVKLRDGAIWSSFSTDVHGLHANSPEIKNAKGIEIVWNEFVSYIDKNIGRDQRGCLVAWNGESCDMKLEEILQ